jgi:glycerophosphoryl diester phosphodiesterase
MVFLVLILIVLFIVSRQYTKAPLPVSKWKFFKVPGAVALDGTLARKLEGVYSVKRGNSFFGDQAVIKWSSTIEDGQPSYKISIFFEQDAGYIICEGKRTKHQIILHGYWSKPFTSETGEVSFVIRWLAGAGKLLKDVKPWAIIIKGRFWAGGVKNRMVFRYHAPLQNQQGFQVLGHRGAGRNIDFLPASENSLELLRMAPAMGVTGVEIDVNRTADKELVVFHDMVLSMVSIQDYYQVQPVGSMTYLGLQNLRLKKGEKIPTLREALEVILNETSMEVVWLDIKYDGDLSAVAEMQKEFVTKASAINRKLDIYIGIPDERVLSNFTALSNYTEVPSLIELEPDIAEQIHAQVWTPKWTGGLRNREVEELRKKGIKAYTWTVDEPEDLYSFLNKGKYDGILTNFPTLLAYYYHTRKS